MFHTLPLFAKILVVIAAFVAYIYLIRYASKFCAFNDTPKSYWPKDRRGRDSMLTPYFDDTH